MSTNNIHPSTSFVQDTSTVVGVPYYKRFKLLLQDYQRRAAASADVVNSPTGYSVD